MRDMPPDDPALVTRLSARFLRHARGIAVAVVLAIVLVQWVRIFGRPYGDFHLHYRFAEQFAAGKPLHDLPFHKPYPPFWAMAHVPLLALPLHAAQIALYPVGLLGILLLIAVLLRLTSSIEPSSKAAAIRAAGFTGSARFWTVMIALLLASRYLVRDLVECSVNTWLVALSWLGVYLWMKGRDGLGGLSLGLAIALKMTAALFVPYFLLKRQWKMAAAATFFAALFTIAPIVRYGPGGMLEHLRIWSGNVIAGVTAQDPSYGVNGAEPYNNMSLRPAIARYLMRLPEGHPGRIDSALYVDVLALSPSTAGWVIRIATAALVIAAAWAMRRRLARRDDPAALYECAAVSLLILLLSPITWGQHCAGVLPAVFLIAHRVVHRRPLEAWMKAAMVLYVIAVLVLNRGLLGKELAILAESYRPETWAILAVFCVMLRLGSMPCDVEARG